MSLKAEEIAKFVGSVPNHDVLLIGREKTNADRIRAMTDEELADWYCKRRECGTCTFDTASGCQLLDWLKSPVEVDE